MANADDTYKAESAGLERQERQSIVPKADEDDIQWVRDSLRVALAYYGDQLEEEKEVTDFEFEDMWPKEARQARQASEDDEGRLVPGKPTLEVHLLDQNIEQITADARQARLSLTVKPKAGLATSSEAEQYKGKVKWIQDQCNASSIRISALQRAARCGRGGYFIWADYADETPDIGESAFDLELTMSRILEYENVFWDPNSTEMDRREAEWCLMARWISESEHKRRYPDKPLTIPSEDKFKLDSGIDNYNDWFEEHSEETKGHRRVRVVVAWKLRYTPVDIGYHPAIGSVLLSDAPPDIKQAIMRRENGTRIRKRMDKTIDIIVCDGTQVLERSEWRGTIIPVVETIAREYVVNGRRRMRGIVKPAMSILRAINVVLSAAVEAAGSVPRSPYMMVEGQDAGFEREWDEIMTVARGRVRYRRVTLDDGSPAPPPQRQSTEPEVQGMLLLLRALHEMYYSVTGSIAPQARAINPYDRSGKAIEALLAQSRAGTSSILDNLANVALPWEGRILIDAIPGYYDRPGRITRVMSGEDGDPETAIMIKRPFIIDDDGIPQPVPCPMCGGQGSLAGQITQLTPIPKPVPCEDCGGDGFATEKSMPERYMEKRVRYIDFDKGRYTVSAVLDRNFKTTQDEALAGMEALAAAAPALVPQYADLWVRSMAFSGSAQIADRLAAANPALNPDQEEDELEGMPAEAKAKINALKMQHGQMMQALQQAQKLIETDAVKSAGQKEVASIRGALQMQLAKLKAQGDIMKQQREQMHERGITQMQAAIEAMQKDAERRHEILMLLLQEQSDKSIERHSVALHDAAAQRAADQIEASNIRTEARQEGATVRAEDRQEGRDRRTLARQTIAGEMTAGAESKRAEAGERREEQRSVRSEARQEARDVAAEKRASKSPGPKKRS